MTSVVLGIDYKLRCVQAKFVELNVGSCNIEPMKLSLSLSAQIYKIYHRNLHPEQLFTGCPSVIVMPGWLTSSSATRFDCRCCESIYTYKNQIKF